MPILKTFIETDDQNADPRYEVVITTFAPVSVEFDKQGNRYIVFRIADTPESHEVYRRDIQKRWKWNWIFRQRRIRQSDL